MRCPFSFEYGGGQRRGKAASHPEVLYQKQKYLKCVLIDPPSQKLDLFQKQK